MDTKIIANNEGLALPVGVTLDRFIQKNQDNYPGSSGELSQLLRDIGFAGKVINLEINKGGLNNINGPMGQNNVQGESQQKLDYIADIRFLRALTNGNQVCAVISEENENVIELNINAKYVVAIDPLDGSSNIDLNVSIGTIFSIYKRKTPVGTSPTLEDVLRKGNEQIGAGYIVYGSSTILVYTTGNGVNGFTYDNTLGEYFLSHVDIKIPKTGSIFSVNEGNYYQFEKNIQSQIEVYKKRGFQARYIGSLVADFHRNLLKGGIYMYPATDTYKQGKLRLMYELFPLSMIVEQAGGKASNGVEDILNIQVTNIHQRDIFYIGSADLVDELM